ncbi:MAG: double-strand break repair helicase AddA [Pseudomonadota bacterium]
MNGPGPTAAQREAADPRASAWVGANAGSGKTRVLTNRVARLLLAGSRPERILCLTYTRAAAAEMQTRLFDQLGAWAMLEDAALGEALSALTGEVGFPPHRLAEARRLFALALETPGGLRIQTIHAFCEHLIRRFPLEAGADPGFTLADDRQMAALKAGLSQRLGAAAAAGEDDAFDRLALRLAETQLEPLLFDVARMKAHLPADADALGSALAAHYDPALLVAPADVLANAAEGIDWAQAAALSPELMAGGKRLQDKAPLIATAVAAMQAGDTAGAIDALSRALMKAGGQDPQSLTWLFGKKRVEGGDPVVDRVAALQCALARAKAALRDSEAARRAEDLNRFAMAWMAGFAAAKTASGLMDFDDLVSRTAAMLRHGEAASWVLYRLDGGIDHVLVDEAQDTAPAQWDIVTAITGEFMAGEGGRMVVDAAGRPMPRTLFVVGDEKQSIYSFQGADPATFGRVRDSTRRRLADGGMLVEPALARSFRSAPGILDFVDLVFAGSAASGLTIDGAAPMHETSRLGDGATIDLWALLQPEGGSGEKPWHSPLDEVPAGAPKRRLAHLLAREIARICAHEMLPHRAGEAPRRVRPGDIMVLVRRRDVLAQELVRALKAGGVPVAGADRITLMDEIAVRDLLAALRVAALPDDDLSLAALLRSPLGCVDEDALMALAAGRKKGERLSARLAEAADRHPRSAALVADLLARADFLRPYEMLERILTHHDGRRRLLARLGAECEDAIDELLVQALVYEAAEAPTLTGFVAWLESAETVVKRDVTTQGGADDGDAPGAVRVMTVHGAKGLEAPVVILPDTMDEPGRLGGGGRVPLFTLEGGDNTPPLVTLAGRKTEDDDKTRAAREAAARREIAEHKRLLYVALTRAERRLVLCGAGRPPGDAEGDGDLKEERRAAVWYRLLSDAMERAGASEIAPPDGIAGARRLGDDPVVAEPAFEDTAAAVEASRRLELPDWVSPAPAEARPPRLSPSTLVEHGPGEDRFAARETGPDPGPQAVPEGGDGRGGTDPRLYGLAVHALIEQPPTAPQHPAAIASRAAPGIAAEAVDLAIAEAEAARSHPDAEVLFGAEALVEATLAIPVSDALPPMIGRVDRLVILPDRVLLADIKTDRPVPRDERTVPEAYAAQLGAYAAALSAIHARPVSCLLLYTAGPRLVTLPTARCLEAFERATRRVLGSVKGVGAEGSGVAPGLDSAVLRLP